jgi:hypothetical protein
MSKLNRSEFKELLTEWKQNFINEFRDTSSRKELPGKPDGFPIENMEKFRSWLITKLKELSEQNVTGFDNLRADLELELEELSRNSSSEEEDVSLVFNTFIEYKEGENDLGGETGKEFLNHIGFEKDESNIEDNFVYIVVSPFQKGLLKTTLSHYSYEHDNGRNETDPKELKNFFVGEFFPGFDIDVVYKSTHPDIQSDIQSGYFLGQNAECILFKL